MFLDGHADDPHDNATEAALGLIAMERVYCRIVEYVDDQIGMAIIGQRQRAGMDCEIVLSGVESAMKNMRSAIAEAMRPEF